MDVAALAARVSKAVGLVSCLKLSPQSTETASNPAFRGTESLRDAISVYVGYFGRSPLGSVVRERLISRIVATGKPMLLVTDISEADAVLTAVVLDSPATMSVRLTGRGGRILWATQALQGSNVSASAGIAEDILRQLTAAIQRSRQ
jgi:hypothetical protein